MLQRTIRILFLYAEVQPYLLHGIKELLKAGAEVTLVCWKTPDNAPLQLKETTGLKIIEKGNADKQDLYASAPDIVFISGWMDKAYLQWAKHFKNQKAKVIMAMDAKWEGTLRQKVNSFLSSFTIQPYFTHAWVSGYFQYEYARRLGFKSSNILKDLLTPDTTAFNEAYDRFLPEKEKTYPKTFLYVGRLIPNKFQQLLLAFTSLTDEERKGWKLIVAGKGEMEQHEAMKHAAIVYKSFIQPNELPEIAREAGVFCLLSMHEAWGAVIHEFAAAGLPLLVSANCGAHYSFLIDGYNGFLCKENTIEEIKAEMLRFINMGDAQLLAMGKRSNKLAAGYSPEIWAARMLSVLED